MKLKLVGNYTYGTTKKFRVFENELGNKYLEKTTSIKNYEILKNISDISIESENLLEIIAFNKKDEDTLNYYIEFLEGKTLEQIILKEESIDYHEVKKIILQICNGLKSLHDQDILHRDIKPANIILLKDNLVKVIDFDISRKYDESKSKKEDSKKGTYGNNYPAGPWYKQIGSLEEYVLQNNKFPKLKDGKDVDAVTSATLNLSGFEDAFNNLKEQK